MMSGISERGNLVPSMSCFIEPFVPHIREILERMNKVKGQDPATIVEASS